MVTNSKIVVPFYTFSGRIKKTKYRRR